MNSKAKSKPEPEYPQSAKLAKVSGEVMVQVTVDESGLVVSAVAVKGPLKLRKASEVAARKAQFDPLILSGQKVKVSGILIYQFNSNQR